MRRRTDAPVSYSAAQIAWNLTRYHLLLVLTWNTMDRGNNNIIENFIIDDEMALLFYYYYTYVNLYYKSRSFHIHNL